MIWLGDEKPAPTECCWQHTVVRGRERWVCLTRAGLKAAVERASSVKNESDAKHRHYSAAIRRFNQHACEPAPDAQPGGGASDPLAGREVESGDFPGPSPVDPYDVTPEDIERLVNKYGLLYHRAITASDLVEERDECRRNLLAMIERYRAEASPRGRFRQLLEGA